jgi:hypothetical protein
MAAIGRQIQLRWSTEVLDLTIAPYTVLANQGFVSAGENLEIRTRVDAVTLNEVERAVSMVRAWLCNAAAWNDSGLGKPVEIWMKTCDNLVAVAEIGATWRKKEIRGGDVIVQPKAGTAATPTADVQISLQVEPVWRRAAPEPLLRAVPTQLYFPAHDPITYLAANAQGWLTALDGTQVMARRVSWSATTGLTIRCHFVHRTAMTNQCSFLSYDSETLQTMSAYWLPANKQFSIRDAQMVVATSPVFAFADGQVVDVIFRWSETLGMGIWVDGTKVASNATCDINTSVVQYNNILINNSFDLHTGTVDDGVSDTWPDWNVYNIDDGAGRKAEATATAHMSTRALKLIAASSGATPMVEQTVYLDEPGVYNFSLMARGNGLVAGQIQVLGYNGSTFVGDLVALQSTGVTGTSYTIVSRDFTYAEASGIDRVVVRLLAPATAGTCYFDAVSLNNTVTELKEYRILDPGTSGVVEVANIQVWPGLTDAECAGLSAYGRPDPELPFLFKPISEMQYRALYRLYNGPGDTWSPLRLWARARGQNFTRIQMGWRTGRELELMRTLSHQLICEIATLGTDTARVADVNACTGYVARVTPTNTSWITRVTLALANDPDDVLAVRGEHRLLLACRDASASKNLVRWRLVVAGRAGAWSTAVAPQQMSTYSLVDVGRVIIPPGKWLEESYAATTSLFSGTYITLEVQVQNSVGSGGGTFDLDSVFLFPSEVEGTATALWGDASTNYMLLDWGGESPTFVAVRDVDTFEFAAWMDYVGDAIAMLPRTVGMLTLGVFRNSMEQANMLDMCEIAAYVETRWA